MREVLNIDLDHRQGNFRLQMKASIPEGIAGVFGPSGSGKSTLLKLLAGIEKPDEGTIIVNGETIFSKKEKRNVPLRKRQVGLVFQEGRLFPHMSVSSNLRYGYSEKSKFSFDEVVDLLEIRHLLDKNPDDCSGGERQRVAIGRMLLHSPKLLLLDEPFSALDQRLRRNIIPFLLKIREKFNLPIVIVSHDLSDLLMLSDQLVLVDGGQIRGIGSYIDLIMNSETRCCLHDEPVVNSIRTEVQNIYQQNGTLSFSYHPWYPDNMLVTETNGKVGIGDRVFFSLFPEDISLALSAVEGISAQNQLAGKLLQIKEEGSHIACLVDVGFPLLVRVTSKAAQKLKLESGMELICFFKTSAIKNLLVIPA